MRTVPAVLLAVVVLLGAARAALPGLLKERINEKLGSLPGGYRGEVEDVSLALHRGTVSLARLELQDAKRDLVLGAEEVRVRVRLRELLRGRLSLGADLEKPFARVAVRRALRRAKAVAAREKEEARKRVARGEEEPAPPPKPLHRMLAELMPFRLERLELRDGEVVVVESGLEARVHDIQVMAHGLTNEQEGRNAKLEASARVMERGHASLRVNADPLQPRPSFDLHAALSDIDLPSLNPVLRWQMGVDVDRGTFTVVAEFEAEGGGFEGYVKPFIGDLKMLDPGDEKKPLKAVKEALVGAVAAVLKNPRTEEVATKLPVKGRFDEPDVGVWAAVLNVLRNAFVEALKPSFEGV